jgi:hypothetical protein
VGGGGDSGETLAQQALRGDERGGGSVGRDDALASLLSLRPLVDGAPPPSPPLPHPRSHAAAEGSSSSSSASSAAGPDAHARGTVASSGAWPTK